VCVYVCVCIGVLYIYIRPSPTIYVYIYMKNRCFSAALGGGNRQTAGIKRLVIEALSCSCMRPEAASVCDLKVLLYEALSC
jgi:hypothetical protein